MNTTLIVIIVAWFFLTSNKATRQYPSPAGPQPTLGGPTDPSSTWSIAIPGFGSFRAGPGGFQYVPAPSRATVSPPAPGGGSSIGGVPLPGEPAYQDPTLPWLRTPPDVAADPLVNDAVMNPLALAPDFLSGIDPALAGITDPLTGASTVTGVDPLLDGSLAAIGI